LQELLWSFKLIRFLAYQYRLFSDEAYDPKFVGAERDRFKKFLKHQIDLDIDKELEEGRKKSIKFSYPDLEYHRLADEFSAPLLSDWSSYFSDAVLEDIYAVYVKHDAPQIGFTVAVAFRFAVKSEAALKKLFVPPPGAKAAFHQEFKGAWTSSADSPRTIPVVVFDNVQPSLLAPNADDFSRVFGAAEMVMLPSGRAVRLERGFPYVSYVVHADIDEVMPEIIHRCDFAMLMALPGFVEGNLESIVQRHREELNDVQSGLASGDSEAEKKYNKAWKSFERVQGVAPKTTAAVQRIMQKYPGKSLFAAIADDNIKLIDFTVNAAILATSQVRGNIESFAQQKIQQSLNFLQKVTTGATIILALGGVATILIAVLHTSQIRIDDKLQKGDPILVRNIQLGVAQSPATLKAGPVFGKPDRISRQQVLLDFTSSGTELPIDLPAAPFKSGQRTVEVELFAGDGTIVAENSIFCEKPPRAVKIFFESRMFAAGREYFVEISEGPVWRLKLPVRIVTH
jgi:hypothetical protein